VKKPGHGLKCSALVSRCAPWTLLANRPRCSVCLDQLDGPQGQRNFPCRRSSRNGLHCFLFIGIPAGRVLTPSCNHDRAPDSCVGADDLLQTTQLIAFDFASTRTGTLEFVENAFIISSRESRMLNYQLSGKHLNRRAARLVDLATRHDKTTASLDKHDVQKSCTQPHAESICVK
jgi:hypothetical protein